ncbi:MAG: response regulator [Verrucomicrobia bacterium]|nr:response regulator [Verrucomicrobiota bacterium]
MTRVLYAEDDPQIAEIVGIYFGQHPGTELTVVSTGRRCLEAMAQGGFDLLLVDLMMPDLDGLQVLGELSARGDPTPVIMVSGHGHAELAVRALRAGAVDCIDKSSPDFRRIPEIALQTINRLRRRSKIARPAGPPLGTRVLYLDPDPRDREQVTRFITSSAPRLRVTSEAPAALERFLRHETTYDAVVLGPNFERTPLLDALRQIRSYHEEEIPVVVLAPPQTGETAIAALKLGARDYILQGPGCLSELVFSLNNALKTAATEHLALQLTDELAALNRSLADQVATRTRELEAEIAVRREAERRAAEQAARSQALSTRLLRVQEDERHALAHELHDQVGQLLTGLRFQLEAARAAPGGPALGEALAVTDDLLGTVRALTLQLRPRMLDDLGLKPALEWHVGNFRRQTGVTVELDLTLPEARLPRDLEITVYRVVQEALTNVARHSGATTANVTVTAGDATLHVEISDRGKGFDAAAALARRDSLGLAGLAERVQLAGGRFELVSRPGHGTRVHGEFDLSPAFVPESALAP